MEPVPDRKREWAWCLYDWANSAFALSAMALFFPVFFKSYWCAGVDHTVSTARLGFGHMAAGLIIALASPFLGALAHFRFGSRNLLFFFMVVGALSISALSVIGQQTWAAALALFLVARVGFALANLFYDAMIVRITTPARYSLISSRGYGFGYLGCGLLGIVHVLMVLKPDLFGLPSKAAAVRVVFLTVGIWWVLFSIPLLRATRGRAVRNEDAARSVRHGLATMWQTAREIGTRKQTLLFLVAFWLYHDGVHAFVMMAADFGKAIGIPDAGLMGSLLLVQFVAFPMALFFGRVAGRIGEKNTLLISIGIYILVTCTGAAILKNQFQFMVLAAITGSAQGAIQALSRSFFSRMVPPGKSSDYFGFYNMVGRFSVVFGPGIVATTALLGRMLGLSAAVAPRIGIASLALLFIAGALVLQRVKVPIQPETGA